MLLKNEHLLTTDTESSSSSSQPVPRDSSPSLPLVTPTDFIKKMLQSKSSSPDIPEYHTAEIVRGRVVGRGGYAVVRELAAIQLHSRLTHVASAGSLSSHGSNGEKRGLRRLRRFSATSRQMSSPEKQSASCGSARELFALSLSQQSRRSKEKYVVKEIDVELRDTNEARYKCGIKDLAAETELLARLKHRSIIDVVAMADTDPLVDGFFSVLPRLSETLQKRLSSWMQLKRTTEGITGALTGGKKKASHLLAEQLTVGHRIADALRYLHDRKIVYRDLKPENIGFDFDDEVKIFDFGLAKTLKESDRLEGSDNLYRLTGMTGSIRYMAPEVGLRKPYNTSVDVYSWGILMWYIMALDPPYSLLTPKQHRDRVFKGGERPHIHEHWNWPRGMAGLLEICWTADARSRPSFQKICYQMDKYGCHKDSNSSSFSTLMTDET